MKAKLPTVKIGKHTYYVDWGRRVIKPFDAPSKQIPFVDLEDDVFDLVLTTKAKGNDKAGVEEKAKASTH